MVGRETFSTFSKMVLNAEVNVGVSLNQHFLLTVFLNSIKSYAVSIACRHNHAPEVSESHKHQEYSWNILQARVKSEHITHI